MNDTLPPETTNIRLCACAHPDRLMMGNLRLSLRGHELAHTQLIVEKCLVCKGIGGFPDQNLTLALSEGTPEALGILEALAK